jgi:hypothetical protein
MSITLHITPRQPTTLLISKAHNLRAPAGGLKDYGGGQFIPAKMVRIEKELAQEAMPDLIEDFSDTLQGYREQYEQQVALAEEGTTKVKLIPLSTIEARIKKTIRNSYARAFILGKRSAGDFTSATADQQKELKKLRYDEFTYLKKFLGAMKDGSGEMPYEKRMEMYAQAVREAYWLGWVLGLPKDETISWLVGPTEHCADCLSFNRHGPYTVEDFKKEVLPKLPNSGLLSCLGFHCQCSLVDKEGKKPSWLPS